MAYKATVIQIMIASPSDVVEERDIVRAAITKWNYINSFKNKAVLIPMGWETHSSPELGERPQELINKRILKDSDILIGIFWTRLGTPTGKAASGTVEEIKRHVESGKPAMIYFSSKPISPQLIVKKQYDSLQKLKDSYKPLGLIEEFHGTEEFKEKITAQLQLCLNHNKYIQNLLYNKISNEKHNKKTALTPLSKAAMQLLKAASQHSDGYIYKAYRLQGSCFEAGRFWFGSTGREFVKWEAALNELLMHKLVKPHEAESTIFILTHTGWELSDIIPEDN